MVLSRIEHVVAIRTEFDRTHGSAEEFGDSVKAVIKNIKMGLSAEQEVDYRQIASIHPPIKSFTHHSLSRSSNGIFLTIKDLSLYIMRTVISTLALHDHRAPYQFDPSLHLVIDRSICNDLVK